MKPLVPLLLVAACLRPSEHHVILDQDVGRAATNEVSIAVDGGLAAVRTLDASGAALWAASPVIDIALTSAGPFMLEVRNIPPDAELTLDGAPIARGPSEPATVGRWDVTGGSIRIAPPDGLARGPFRIAVLSDIQGGVTEVQDVFSRMNRDPLLRFVLSTGDLTQNGTLAELERIQLELESLRVPLYSTVGNHEVPATDAWHALFGPFSSYFEFRGVAFALVDSSNATVDPRELESLRTWVGAHVDGTQLFFTHVPLFDVAGLRSGAFRSRNEAARLVNLLAEAEVDALFFGHVHSYYAYALGGIDTYISGGGTVSGEELDGIGRHYLAVDLDPDGGVLGVELVRID